MCRFIGCAIGLSTLLAFTPAARGAIYNEVGDQSHQFATVSVGLSVGVGIDRIDGSISSGDEGDLFKLTFGGSGSFLLTLTGDDLLSLFGDPELFLFDALGNPLAHDDDSGPFDNSLISVTVPGPGTYYVGIGDFNLRAVGNGSSPNWSSGSPPANFGTLVRIENFSTISTFNYRLGINPATSAHVPEPATLALWGGMSLLGLTASRRRRRGG